MTYHKLTLACPEALSEQVTEFLLDSDWLESGFTTIAASGHGVDFSKASLREQVRGRIQVALVIVVLPAGQVGDLLTELRTKFRAPHIRYWVEPVENFGVLA